jgi:putative transposase
MRSYKYRLYPTQQQEQKLVETLDGCRWVYNYFVDNGFESEYDMNYALTELKEQEPWLRNYHSKMLQMVGKQIAASIKALSVLKKKGHRTGKLHYLTHDRYNSFTYNQSGFKIERHGQTDLLWLSKVGYVQIRLHRKPVNIKQVTVCRQNGKWYAVVACETAKQIFQLIDPRKSVGIDVGITKFAYDSDSHSIDNPLFLTKLLKPLRRIQRKVSRRQKGSKNYEKAKSRVARLHERIARKRNDFLHKTSRCYADRYDVVFLERLRTLNMVRNHRVARYVLDSGWRTFKTMLGYKAKMVVEVDPKNTSVDCSACGNKVPKELAVRTHKCDRCGLVIDRDYNASMNILQKGLLYLPVGRREVTPVEIALQSRNQEGAHVKRG